VTHTVVSAACGVAKVLDLDVETTRDAVGIAGTARNALRVTRTGGINEWRGIAAANAARNAVYACLLAENGMRGPNNLFEGQKGWQQVISGDFEVDLDPECTSVHDVIQRLLRTVEVAERPVRGPPDDSMSWEQLEAKFHAKTGDFGGERRWPDPGDRCRWPATGPCFPGENGPTHHHPPRN
jgi:2-methylcitrate dehydratase PrpD